MHRTHRLRLIGVDESGLEEWACPVCGRRMLLRWPPDCHKEVVFRGDEEACHVADGEPAAGSAPGPGAAGRLRETGVAFAARRRPSPHIS